ncbi:MAG: hypothetical protein IJY26_01225, partial [Clostridia bacterium]|nr:hypothetical protein [Clostridia bacterium]
MKYCDLHCDLLRKLTDAKSWISTTEKENFQITPNGLLGGVFLQTFAVFAPNAEANMAYFFEKSRLFEEIKAFLSP